MEKSKADQLAEDFADAQVKRHPHKGLDYIPISEVIARLNRVLGVGSWKDEIIRLWECGVVETAEAGQFPKWIMAHVRITGVLDGHEFCHEGVGGHEVQFTKKGPVDLGDNYKSATSDALKKASQKLGIALNLARDEEAMAAEREAAEPKANPYHCQAIGTVAKELPDEQRTAFVGWWNDLTGGKKFASGTVTVTELQAAAEKLGIKLPDPETGELPE